MLRLVEVEREEEERVLEEELSLVPLSSLREAEREEEEVAAEHVEEVEEVEVALEERELLLRELLAAERVGEALEAAAVLEERLLEVAVLLEVRLVAVERVGVALALEELLREEAVEALEREVPEFSEALEETRVVVPRLPVVAGPLEEVLWLLLTCLPVVGLLSRVAAVAEAGTVGRFMPGVQGAVGVGAGCCGVRM